MGLLDFRKRPKLLVKQGSIPEGKPFSNLEDVKKKKQVPSIEKFNPRKGSNKSIRTPLESFYSSSQNPEGWILAEYDLAEPYRISDTESLVRQSIKKKVALAFKQGYEFTSANKKSLRYLRLRLEQIAYVTGIPTVLFVRRLFRDLVTCNNAFAIKVRDDKASGGRRRVDKYGKNLTPVAGYFIAHPSTMQPKVKDRKVIKWKHKLPNGNYREFLPEDVIHLHLDKRAGFFFAPPLITPVKDDIRALRKIEENVEMMLYQYLFPLFHYTVGTKEHPSTVDENGEDEISVVKSQLSDMTAEGGIVTSFRHQIKLLGIEGRQMNAENYLKHFMQRVLGGLGISEVDIGVSSSANRNTADSFSRSLIDSVKDVQLVLKYFIQQEIIQELMLESTFANNMEQLFEEENKVNLDWHEIDTDYLVKIQNHSLDMFLKNGITMTELRKALGKDPIAKESDSAKDLQWEWFEKPALMIKSSGEQFSSLAASRTDGVDFDEGDYEKIKKQQEQHEIKIKKSQAQGQGSGSKSGSSSGKKTNVGAKVKPKNQHGAGVPTGPKKDALILEDRAIKHETETTPQNPRLLATQSRVIDSYSAGNFLKKDYRNLRNTIVDYVRTLDSWRPEVGYFENKKPQKRDTDYIYQLLENGRDSWIRKLRAEIYNVYRDGHYGNAKTSERRRVMPLHVIRHIDDRIDKYTKRLKDALHKNIKKALIDKDVQDGKISPELSVKNRFDALEFRTDFLCGVETDRAHRWGKLINWCETSGLLPEPVKIGKKLKLFIEQPMNKIPFVSVDAQDGACDICVQNAESWFMTDVNSIYFDPDRLPKFHPGCECAVKMEIFDFQEVGEKPITRKEIKEVVKATHPDWNEAKIEASTSILMSKKAKD